MLLEIAIGDAYGAGFEFASAEKVRRKNHLISYQQHELGMPMGSYTDDTQMSLALAELLIDKEELTHASIAEKFVQCFKRDIRKGYSKGLYQLLESVESGKEFLEKIQPISTRNGAAMRSAPLGIISNIDDLMAMSELHASVTHNTTIGIKSAQAVALAAHYLIYKKGPIDDLFKFVCEYSKFKWSNTFQGEVACCAEDTINALLTILKNNRNARDVLQNSVNFCGDVDTVASLGLGLASLSDEIEQSLPIFLYDNLENGKFGRDYIVKKANSLMALART